jgi:hypothetical protein
MAQLLSNLPIGAKVKFGKYSVNGETAQPIIWLVVAKNHSSTPTYPTNSVTLLAEKIVDLRCADASEPNNSNSARVSSGNNRYSLSNIDQWLNKDNASGSWYSNQHSADQSPNSSLYVLSKTEYADRPGFLNAFTTAEKNAIQDTIIRVVKSPVDGSGYEDISRKVFVPSVTEVGLANENGIAEGAIWSYFSSGSRIAYLTSQAFNNTLSDGKPSKVTSACSWWLRTPSSSDAFYVRIVSTDGTRFVYSAHNGNVGVRPALNLSSTLPIYDTVDSDGCYTVVWNSAPSAPVDLDVPTIYGGKSNSISWSKAIDPDGDAVTYQLECSVNGGTYTGIYSGTSQTYVHLVPFGTNSVTYRVRATDPSGESSAYKTSATITVINNYAPVISGTDSNLGVKSSGFTGTYTITDANNNAVTVTESIDGVQIRSLVATLGQAITYGVSENTWLALPNGSHTLTIRATDGIDTSVRTYTFTKLVDTLKIQNATPWVSSTMPSRIMLVVTRNIPSAATFKVEVCNNGYDASPTWEDCTDAVRSGLVHVFSNTKKTATNWGVLVRVTVARNGATGACYISAIGGNFE